MVDVKIPLRKLPGIVAHHKWLCSRPAMSDLWQLTSYFHCRSTRKQCGFIRIPKYTILVDLQKTEPEIMDGFRKNTRYEVRRALKEGIVFAAENQANIFYKFHNEFSQSKGRTPLDKRDFDAYWPHIVVTKAVVNNEPLAMHSYLKDIETRRVVLLHSASSFRLQESGEQRNLIGRANRMLHFKDMMFFKEQGMLWYDLGGYAKGAHDPELININEFKESFGGQTFEESTYISCALYLWRRVRGV